MSTLNDDIAKAMKIIDSKNYDNQFDCLYPFCNENIGELFSYFDFRDKNVLSVLASSDQILDMHLRGAKNITTFDINWMTKYYYYLKKAAIMSGISFEEFVEYFCFEDYDKGCNRTAFNQDTFERIRNYLPEDMKIFWSRLYNSYSPQDIRVPYGMFTIDENSKDVLSGTVAYFNEENFEILRETIHNLNINFINSDIKTLPIYLEGKYDIMYFSNIIQYTEGLFKNYNELDNITNQKSQLLKFKNLLNQFYKYLVPGGYCLVGYLYEPEYTDRDVAIFNKKLRKEIFNEDNYFYLYIRAVQNFQRKMKFDVISQKQDTCLVYKR